MKGKYNPRMNASELRHRGRVELEPCFGCAAWPTVAHHTLLKFPEKRWRRDHRMLLPVCPICHTEIHDRFGDEGDWLASFDATEEQAIAYIKRLWDASEEEETRAVA